MYQRGLDVVGFDDEEVMSLHNVKQHVTNLHMNVFVFTFDFQIHELQEQEKDRREVERKEQEVESRRQESQHRRDNLADFIEERWGEGLAVLTYIPVVMMC